MFDNVWAQQGQAMGNLTNAIAGYKDRQSRAEAAQMQQAAANKQLSLNALQQQRDNSFEDRRLRLQEGQYEQKSKINALDEKSRQADVEAKQREQNLERMKVGYHMLDSVKDQPSLDNMRNISAQMYGEEALEQIPTVYNADTASKIAGQKDMYGGILRDKLKQTQMWVEDPNGQKQAIWGEEGKNVELAEGWKHATAPNDDMEMQDKRAAADMQQQQLKSKTEIDKAKIVDERERYKTELDQAAKSKGKGFDREMKMRDKFLALPEVKAFTSVNFQHKRMVRAMGEIKEQQAKGGSMSLGPADEALVMSLKKMMDEGVVMPSEFERTAESMSIPSAILAKVSTWRSGGNLNDAERDAIMRLGGHFLSVAKEGYDEQADYTSELASGYGLDPINVVRLGGAGRKTLAEKQELSGGETMAAHIPGRQQQASGGQQPGTLSLDDFLKEI